MSWTHNSQQFVHFSIWQLKEKPEMVYVGYIHYVYLMYGDFPGGSVVPNPPASAGDAGLIPRLGRTSGERNGNPLQYSCLAGYSS